VIDTDLDATDYEYSVLVDGVVNFPDSVRLWANTTQQTSGDPGDNPETLLHEYLGPLVTGAPGFGYAREVSAGTNFPMAPMTPDADFFLDWAFERSQLTAGGINLQTPLRIACATSNNGTFLSVDFTGPKDLPILLSDPVVCDANGCNQQNCTGFGMSCSAGIGACMAMGTVVCDDMNMPVCNAVAGMPSMEMCGDGIDSDCDGNPNNGCTGMDTDGDGLFDMEETVIGTDPNDADSDDDGIPDGQEPGYNVDTDGDGYINALDPDSDNDGLFDGTEVGNGCNNPGTDPAAGHCIADGDMGMTTTDPLDADTDNGGVSDGAEDTDRDGVVDTGERNPTAGNGADDTSVNDDPDGDGLPTPTEESLGTDPNDADSDDDGVPDGQEPNPTLDSDGDGLINPLDPDSDNDGLFDGTEMGRDCSNQDTDPASMNCTPDGDMGMTTTSPIDPDTDDGGVTDGSEDKDLDGQIDQGETNPTAGNGADDSTNPDMDGDGLTDEVETTDATLYTARA
jgi:hypothetical protein